MAFSCLGPAQRTALFADRLVAAGVDGKIQGEMDLRGYWRDVGWLDCYHPSVSIAKSSRVDNAKGIACFSSLQLPLSSSLCGHDNRRSAKPHRRPIRYNVSTRHCGQFGVLLGRPSLRRRDFEPLSSQRGASVYRAAYYNQLVCH